jgi:hypothetical protein
MNKMTNTSSVGNYLRNHVNPVSSTNGSITGITSSDTSKGLLNIIENHIQTLPKYATSPKRLAVFYNKCCKSVESKKGLLTNGDKEKIILAQDQFTKAYQELKLRL